MIRVLLFLTCFASCTPLFAQQDLVGTFSEAIGSGDKPVGVAVDCGVGNSNITIDYLNGAKKAVYNGLEIHAGAYVPLYFGSVGSIDATLGGRFITAHNTANSNKAAEHMEQIAINLGVRFKFYRLALGVENAFAHSNHYWVGLNTDQNKYNFNALLSYIGLDFNLTDNLKMNFKYSKGSGAIGSSQTNLGSSSSYNDSTIGVSLVYASGDDLTAFLGKLLK